MPRTSGSEIFLSIAGASCLKLPHPLGSKTLTIDVGGGGSGQDIWVAIQEAKHLETVSPENSTD